MAKKGIHPKTAWMTMILQDGTKIPVISTMGKPEMHLVIDRTKHPAWSGQTSFINKDDGNVATFNKKFGDLF